MACKQRDRKAQQLLFDRYSPSMMGVCRRYVHHWQDAEDVLIDGFYKVLTHIHTFKDKGSFEGWIRRIIVNEALMFLRKRQRLTFPEHLPEPETNHKVSVEEDLAAQDILDLLEKLPTGYRTVFNLYVVEGYKHREIAEILGISINTSKSQLILAKKRLQQLMQQWQD